MPRLAVIGHPVAHSRSPAMQTAALEALGLAREWSYGALDIAPAELGERLPGLAAEGFAGVNVTVPHKEAALAFADSGSDAASEIGAANTLVFAGGEIAAHNTDAKGFLRSLPEPPAGKRALVLGAGGAARAIVWALLGSGAEVFVWNRDGARAERLCGELGGNVLHGGEGAATRRAVGGRTFDLIVNATAVGLHGEDPFGALPLTAAAFGPGQTVLDMVYPAGGSRLLAAAVSAGAVGVDGIEVLVQQGALSLEIWTGRSAPLEIMRAAAKLGGDA